MICPSCQSESSVHIFDPQAGQMLYYCQSCKKAIVPENSLKCPGCGLSEYHFLSRGLCGCEDCYTVFRSSIVQGIESYRKRVFTKSGGYRLPTSSALARLQTYFEVAKAEHPLEPATNNVLPSAPEVVELQPHQVQIRVRMARNVPGMNYGDGARYSRFLHRLFLSDGGFLSRIWRSGPADHPDHPCRNVTTGDEDHFRFSWSWVTGAEIADGEQKLARIIAEIRALDRAFVWQHSTIFGSLTACPTNSGSGLRMSARLRIPGLLSDPSWLRWKRELHRAGFEVRPGSGEKAFPDGLHILLATRELPMLGFRPVLERFRIYIARLMVREARIAEKILAI